MKKYLSHLYYEVGYRHLIMRLRVTVLGLLNFAHRPELKFIIFSQGRSGSTLLSDLLSNAPELFVDGEVFGAKMPIRILFPRCYLNLRMKSNKSRAYGCKIKIYDLEMHHGWDAAANDRFLRALIAQDWKIIHLRRHNKLRQALSSLVAEETETYHVKQNPANRKVTIPVDEIPFRHKWLKKFDEREDKILEGLSCFSVSYEHDLLNPERHQPLLDALTDYLGVKRCIAKTSYQRTGHDDLPSYISNYEELVRVLEDNGLDHYLEAPG